MHPSETENLSGAGAGAAGPEAGPSEVKWGLVELSGVQRC